jgi:thioredoxin reductase
MPVNNVIIIGGGPAGIAAAIQLKRSGLNPIIFEKGKIGGLLNNAVLVENYPGFPGGISGSDLVVLFKEQIKLLEIEVIYEYVKSLDYHNGLFNIQTDSQKKMLSKTAIVASGTKPRRSSDAKISNDIKDKIYYEIYDILDNEGKSMAIVGSGDAAFDYALNLGRKNKITVLNRGNKVKCLPLLFSRAQNTANVNYIPQARVLKVDKFSADQLVLKYNKNGEDIDIISDFVILAIGREPYLDYMTDGLKKIKAGLEKEEMLHFIGDVRSKQYRQASIAIGDGILAAMKIERKFRNKTI